jgi:hypothetical protein
MVPWCACTLAIMAGFAAVGNAQTEKAFPTDAEINLVLTQTERAIQQYKPLIDQEERALATSGKDAIRHDRQVLSGLETAVKAFKSKPQGFNGPLGFAFFEWLDDASRNATACSSGVVTEALSQVLAGNTDKASSLIHLAHACMDVSTLIYTISENAGSLYKRYVEAEKDLAEQAADVAQSAPIF